MTVDPATTGFRLRGWHVLAMMVGFFGVVAAVDLGFALLAVRTFPGQVSVTPYEDGLMYNRQLTQLAAQERLGWRATAAAEPGAVVMELRSRAGAPIQGLVLSGKLERPATEAGRIGLTFREDAPGRYVARAGRLAGAWDLTARAVDAQGRLFQAERRLTWR